MPRQTLVSLELLELLEGTFKDEMPSKSQLKDEREVWFKAGQVDVVKYLKYIYEEDDEDVLRLKTEDS